MNAVAKSPEWSGYDPATGGQTATTFTFICGDCGRTEHRPTPRLPEGWDRFALYGDHRDLIRCPDCNEAIEQAKFAELQHRLCDYHEPKASQRAQEGAHFAAMAEAIVNSDPVIGVYAACEWSELSEDGRAWVTAIVRAAYGRGTAAYDAVIGIHPLKPGKPSGLRPFAIYLERNEGQYLVAMTPEAALMRLSPIGFFLSGEGARTTAWELLKYADLAEAPGTLPTTGASK